MAAFMARDILMMTVVKMSCGV